MSKNRIISYSAVDSIKDKEIFLNFKTTQEKQTPKILNDLKPTHNDFVIYTKSPTKKNCSKEVLKKELSQIVSVFVQCEINSSNDQEKEMVVTAISTLCKKVFTRMRVEDSAFVVYANGTEHDATAELGSVWEKR